MDLATLKEFEEMTHKDFAGIGSYLTYILVKSVHTIINLDD